MFFVYKARLFYVSGSNHRMNSLNPEQMTVELFFFFAQETLELAHSTVAVLWGQNLH